MTHDEFFDAFQGERFRLKTVCLFQRFENYWTVYPEKLFPLPSVCLLASEEVVSFFICFWSELATEVVLHGTIRMDSKNRSQNVNLHDSFWRGKNWTETKLFLSVTRIDFAVGVSGRAVRISSRAARVSPALSLRRVRPSYGTFSFMVLKGNCARGRTGHMI